MAYKVIKKFRDKDDRVFDVGESYPFSTVTKERLTELSTDGNKYGVPFIEEVKEEPKKEPKKSTKKAGE